MHDFKNTVIEEVLEFIYTLREEGIHSVEELLNISQVKEEGASKATLAEMEENGLVVVSDDEITLTQKGEEGARDIVRRHRLAELLLTEILELNEEDVEKNACSFEHSLTPEVTENICTMLGHPPTCPHGLEIPKGDCCKKADSTFKPLVRSLIEFGLDVTGRILFVKPESKRRIDTLSAMGLVPGAHIKIVQKKPAFVIELGETTLALDPEIVKDIFVRKIY